MFEIIKNSLKKGLVTQKVDALPSSLRVPEVEAAGRAMQEAIRARFGRSLHLREVDSGSCGACESEIVALNNPLYDLQRFGIDFVASPRHADALVVTGPVTRNMAQALAKTFAAMPEPKFVITVGDCASKGGIFAGSYYVSADIAALTCPVALHIPGCPPDPLTIMQYLRSYLTRQ